MGAARFVHIIAALELLLFCCFLVAFVLARVRNIQFGFLYLFFFVFSGLFLHVIVLPGFMKLMRAVFPELEGALPSVDFREAYRSGVLLALLFASWRISVLISMGLFDSFPPSWGEQTRLGVSAAIALSAGGYILYVFHRLSLVSRCTQLLRAALVGEYVSDRCKAPEVAPPELDLEVVRAEELDLCQFGRFCAVCMIECDGLAVVCRLPCTHVFHEACIQGWFRRDARARCPVCMRRVLEKGVSTATARRERSEVVVSI